MALEFKDVSRQVEGRMHIHPTDVTLEKLSLDGLCAEQEKVPERIEKAGVQGDIGP